MFLSEKHCLQCFQSNLANTVSVFVKHTLSGSVEGHGGGVWSAVLHVHHAGLLYVLNSLRQPLHVLWRKHTHTHTHTRTHTHTCTTHTHAHARTRTTHTHTHTHTRTTHTHAHTDHTHTHTHTRTHHTHTHAHKPHAYTHTHTHHTDTQTTRIHARTTHTHTCTHPRTTHHTRTQTTRTHISVHQFAMATNSCVHKIQGIDVCTGSAPKFSASDLCASRSLCSASERRFIVIRGTKSHSLTFTLTVPTWWPAQVLTHLQETHPSLFNPLTLALSIIII